MYSISVISRCMLSSKPVSLKVGTFVDIKVLPIKTHPFDTADAAEDFSLHIKTLHRDSPGVMDHRLSPNAMGSKWE